MADPNLTQVIDGANAGIQDPRIPGLGLVVNSWGQAQYWCGGPGWVDQWNTFDSLFHQLGGVA